MDIGGKEFKKLKAYMLQMDKELNDIIDTFINDKVKPVLIKAYDKEAIRNHDFSTRSALDLSNPDDSLDDNILIHAITSSIGGHKGNTGFTVKMLIREKRYSFYESAELDNIEDKSK